MTWDIREQVLVIKWQSEGHEVRPMTGTGETVGAAVCLRCMTVIHVRARAKALADGSFWRDGAETVRPCKP